MKKIKKNSLQISIVLLIVMIGLLFTNKIDQYPTVSSGIDSWEYNSVAVNFAKFNKFPLMGIYGEEHIYQHNRFERNSIDDYLFCRWYNAGSVYSFEKPPIFSLTLGLFYKIAGVDLANAYRMNFFLLVCCLFFMIKIGDFLFHNIFLSTLSPILYLWFGTYNPLSDVAPDLMLTFLTLLTVYYILRQKNKKDILFFPGLGFLFAILMLTKGNFIFFLMLYPFFLLIETRFSRRTIKGLIFMSLSFLIVILPWVIHSNSLRNSLDYEPNLWAEKLYETEKKCDVKVDSSNIENDHRSIILKKNLHHQLVNHLWGSAYGKSSFILISNQMRTEELRSLHNEFLTSGEWRPEWRYNDTAYYNNNHLESSPLSQIAFFYIENPNFIFKNAYLKIYQAVGDSFPFFCLATLLSGLFLLFSKNKIYQISKFLIILAICLFFTAYYFNFKSFNVVFSSLFFLVGILYSIFYNKLKSYLLLLNLVLFNSFLFVILFYGGQRYVYFIDPFSIIISTYLIYKLILITFREKIQKYDKLF